jgi:hypothetical protein
VLAGLAAAKFAFRSTIDKWIQQRFSLSLEQFKSGLRQEEEERQKAEASERRALEPLDRIGARSGDMRGGVRDLELLLLQGVIKSITFRIVRGQI